MRVNGYQPTEDVAEGVSVSARISLSRGFSAHGGAAGSLSPASIHVHGPGCRGCQDHGKAVMISYSLSKSQRVFDLFLGASDADALLTGLAKIPEQQAKRGLALTLKRVRAKDTVTLHLGANQAEALLTSIRSNDTSIRSYIERRNENAEPDSPPKRARKLSEQEIVELDAFIRTCFPLASSGPIRLDGIDPGVFLAALYNNAKTGGMGVVHYSDNIMSHDEGRHILSELARLGLLPKFDTINGRSIKTFLVEGEGGVWVVTHSRFAEYNTLPIEAVLASVREGNHTRLSGQDILDVENEARILAGESRTEALERTLRKYQNGYIFIQRNQLRQKESFVASEPYQISLHGNQGGKMGREIGHLIAPFNPMRLVVPPPPAPSNT